MKVAFKKNRHSLVFGTESRGSIAIITAFVFTLLVAALAFAIDLGFIYDQKRDLQVVGDTAALSAGYSIMEGKSLADATNDAYSDAQRNGFNQSIANFILNNPPVTGPNASNNNAFEVLLKSPAQYYFLGYFLSPFSLNTRSVSRFDLLSLCAMALGSGTGDGVTVIGTTNVTFKNCSIYINSISQTALTVSGSGSLTSDTIAIVGNYAQKGGGIINTLSPIQTGVPPAPDPYGSLSIPSYTGSSCIATNYSTSGTATLSPGRYCNGITLKSKANVTLKPGTYIIDRGNLTVGAQSSISGAGVTIIFTSSTNSNYGTVNFSAGAKGTMSAPTSGVFNGILFYGDRNSTSVTTKLTGSANLNLIGLLYFPSQAFEFVAGTSTSTSTCLKFIARSISFSGNSNYASNDCSNGSIKVKSNLRLVE